MPQTPAERWDARVWTPGKSATRVFDCPSAANQQDAIDQVAATFSCFYGSQFPLEPFLTVSSSGLSVSTEKGPLLFTVRADYTAGNTGGNSDPLQRQPTYRWLTSGKHEPVDRDADNQAIFNSAFDAPNPKPTRYVPTLALQLTKYETKYNLTRWRDYVGTTNSDSFQVGGFTVEPGQAFFENMEQPEEATFDAKAVKIIYRFLFDPGVFKTDDGVWDSFKIRFVDRGKRAYFPSASNSNVLSIQNIYVNDDSGRPARCSEDVNLNGSGAITTANVTYYVSQQGQRSQNGTDGTPAGATFKRISNGNAFVAIYKNYRASTFGSLSVF